MPASSLRRSNVTYVSIVLKADSGASRHYVCLSDAKILQQKKTIENGLCVSQPDNTIIQGTEQGHLPFSPASLSQKATQAHVFPHLSSALLLSLGQLCDDDCKIYLDKNWMKVYKENKLVLTGKCNFTDGLWDVSLTTNTYRTQQNRQPPSCIRLPMLLFAKKIQ